MRKRTFFFFWHENCSKLKMKNRGFRELKMKNLVSEALKKQTLSVTRIMLMFSLLIGVAFSSPVIAQQTLLEQGITYYRAESYEEALKVLKKARKIEPDSSMAAYYLGITFKKLQNYRKAQPNLEAAVTLTPEIPGAVLELAELYYQLNELKKAEKNVKLAEEKGIRPAQTVFLKGLIFLKEGKNPEAIKAFNTAKELDKTLTQTADYQIGLAYLKNPRLNRFFRR